MNEENTYNLIDEPWIPVLMQDGTNRSVSLGEVFGDADGQIADLALNPYERVAVFRLLLCIAQAALGPERLKDERAWRTAKGTVGQVSSEYLKKWHHRFFLYGPHAFLQPDCVETVKDKRGNQKLFNSNVNKMCPSRASGENSTLFDHAATDTCRDMCNLDRIINFLVFQSFSAGGRFSQCKWDGELSPSNNKEGKANSAWSSPGRESDMLFSILIGATLIESIWLNLLTFNMLQSARIELGMPIWEHDNLSRQNLKEAPWTYLGHLVPLSRIIKLSPNNIGMILGEGIVYPTLNPDDDKKKTIKRPFGWREPMATVKANGDNPPSYVSSDKSRMPWRELVSLLNIHGPISVSSAMALRHRDSLPDDKEFVLWIGGLCTNQAKDVDTVEWRSRLSTDLLAEPKQKRYQDAISYADRQCLALYFACKSFALTVKTPDATKSIKKSKEKELVDPVFKPAEQIYWDILAQPTNQRLVQNVGSDTYMDDWKKATRKAAKEAYRRACPAVTARQMEAYAQGFAKLWVPDGEKDKASGGTDSEQDEGGDHV